MLETPYESIWKHNAGAVMAELKELVLYVVSRHVSRTGFGIGRIRLMKLLFLVDYLYSKRFGRKLTSTEWRMWLFGPFSREVLDALDELELSGELAVERTERGGVFYYAVAKPPRLGESIEKLVDEVIRTYGTKPLEELLEEVYSIDVVRDAGLGDKIL